LILVPFLTIIYDPTSAIFTAALFDFLGGLFLLYSVRKQLNWRLILSIFLMLAVGAVLGVILLERINTFLLKKIIGIAILIFSLIILFQSNNTPKDHSKFLKMLKYPLGFISGFLGGLIGITGPPLIIYMKMLYPKDFFRTQLIGIFFLGAGWRFILFQINQIPMHIPIGRIGIYFAVMLLALWVGTKVHVKVNENLFNKIVAILILIPAINLLIS
jgi:uncharacterized membrane protein YfcA